MGVNPEPMPVDGAVSGFTHTAAENGAKFLRRKHYSENEGFGLVWFSFDFDTWEIHRKDLALKQLFIMQYLHELD